MATPRIATAGWSIPRAVAASFDGDGSLLQRYARRFDGVEINTSFYRPHRRETYARWARCTPDGFRFAVKAPRAITHEARLVDCAAPLAAFAGQIGELGDKLGPVLVQLPPSLAFDAAVANGFFAQARDLFAGPIACEPRHATWFSPQAEALLVRYRVGRVAADPARHPMAATPGGWRGLAYWRLHGAPRMYWSAYGEDGVAAWLDRIRAVDAADAWCVFDNTTSGAAAADALTLQRMAHKKGRA